MLLDPDDASLDLVELLVTLALNGRVGRVQLIYPVGEGLRAVFGNAAMSAGYGMQVQVAGEEPSMAVWTFEPLVP
jgi:hypothetical protein